jgi:hypothetical protein
VSEADLKRCGRCGEELPLAAFNRMGEGRQHWCRECFRAYFRARGDVHRRQVAVRQRRISAAVHGKTHDVAFLIGHGAPAERIHAEIERCEVRCANCHRRATARRGGWLRATGRLDDPAIGLSATKRRNVRHMLDALAGGCVDCGERDVVVLEFDHIGNKRSNVTVLAWSVCSLARLQEEIACCEVRCCNCHRRRTASDRRRRARTDLPSV